MECLQAYSVLLSISKSKEIWTIVYILTIQFEVKRPVTQIKLRKQEFREFYIHKVPLLETKDRSEKSCQSSLTIPSMSRLKMQLDVEVGPPANIIKYL